MFEVKRRITPPLNIYVTFSERANRKLPRIARAPVTQRASGLFPRAA
jgi:hypothetical protein